MQSVSPLIIIFGAVILIWQLFLSIFFIRILTRHRKLAELEGKGEERNLIAKINDKIRHIEEKEAEHIQKVKVIRFNPFNETGGDNSFTLCLLNAKLDGVVLTGLHTREKTRMYVKEVKNGKSSYTLSKEEEKVINL